MEFGSCGNTQGKDNSRSKHGVPEETHNDAFDVNMEASVSADDVILAGRFGASDGISSILPVASDSTDFEDHLHKVRGYEDSDNQNTLEADKDDIRDIDNVKENVEAVNTEASVTSDEVIRAGGFGAKDDISNFLPVASDFTDFEASLRDARDYEDQQEEINRPGLGWTDKTK